MRLLWVTVISLISWVEKSKWEQLPSINIIRRFVIQAMEWFAQLPKISWSMEHSPNLTPGDWRTNISFSKCRTQIWGCTDSETQDSSINGTPKTVPPIRRLLAGRTGCSTNKLYAKRFKEKTMVEHRLLISNLIWICNVQSRLIRFRRSIWSGQKCGIQSVLRKLNLAETICGDYSTATGRHTTEGSYCVEITDLQFFLSWNSLRNPWMNLSTM